ncbi:hypothetical protein CRE_00540 [Caenorhabditis remanei]|uniref:Uncharacterized protein n=1 Tax=Caenorhabditis remanei TaxID=31234 RepID=E3LCX1_CAERE|nr:hypothetical protein CRE_00540 [Caenorhabditis remanei]
MDQVIGQGMPYEYIEQALSFRKSAYFFSRIAMVLEFVSFVMLWTMYINPEEVRKMKCAAWPYFFDNIANFLNMNGTLLFISGASIVMNCLSGSLRRFNEFSHRRTRQGFVVFGNLFFLATDLFIHVILAVELFEQKEGLYEAFVFFTNDIMHSCVIPGKMIRSVVAIYVYCFLIVCRSMLMLHTSIISLNWLWAYIRHFNPYELYYRYLEWRRAFLNGRLLVPSSPSSDSVVLHRPPLLGLARARMGFPPTYEDMLAYDNAPPAYQAEDSEVAIGNSPADSEESFDEIMANDEGLNEEEEEINTPEEDALAEQRSNNNSNSGDIEASFYDNMPNDEILNEENLDGQITISEDQSNTPAEDAGDIVAHV